LCGSPVDFIVDRAGTHSPFLGVWQGKWDTKSCGGLIVERIKSDGSAQIFYDRVHPGSTTPWKKREITASISADGKLLFTDPSNEGKYSFTIEHDGGLDATVHDQSGAPIKGLFRRLQEVQ
jgi:hypothetical protein